MAARRSNKRKRRNRGRFGFLYKLLSLVVILVVVAAGCMVFFRVEEVTVAGQRKYTAQEIIDASGVAAGDNLFLVNSRRVGGRICAELPYVDGVNVRWALPDGVVVTVTERVPAAVIQGGESWWIVDAKGQLLEEAATPQQGGAARVTGLAALLPTVGKKLIVEDADTFRLESLLGLLKALAEREMLPKVSEIDLSSAAEVVMTYDGRLTVKLRMSDDFPKQIRTMAEALEREIIQSNEVGTLDMTLSKPHFIPETG